MLVCWRRGQQRNRARWVWTRSASTTILAESLRNACRKSCRVLVFPGGLRMSPFVSHSPLDKVVVGSYMGMLRIFCPHASRSSEDVQADAQLLEVQLQNAVIQVELGKFVS